MMAFLSRRLRAYLVTVLAAPVAGWLARRLAAEMRRRQGDSRLARALDRGGDRLARRSPKRRRRR